MSTVPACLPRNPQDRRSIIFYRRAAVTAFIAYLTLNFCLDFAHGTSSRLVLTTLAGTLFVGFVVFVSLLVMRCVDEFQRVLLNRAFVVATFVTLGLVAVWGHVEAFSGVPLASVPIVVVPIMLICITAAAKLLIFRRYKSPAE
jgi:hypothetical protein